VDWDDDWTLGFTHHLSPLRLFQMFMEQTFPKLAKAVTVVSRWLYERARSLGFKNIHYVPNVCNPDEFYYDPLYTPKPYQQFIGYMGYLDSGTNWLIDCLMDYFDGTHPQLLMIGPEGMNTRNIKFLGKCTKETARKQLSLCKVLLFPADPNSVIEKARFPIRFNDYLCLNLPIIASDVGEVAWICKNYDCGIVLGRDPYHWYLTLKVLLDMTDEEREADNSKVIEKFHYFNIAKKLEAIYNHYV
jgi:glycosyltransferase involved in cell wall biosynthesis